MKRDKILKIYPDEHAESPRDWDNVGTMACWHNRYNLGDEQPDVDPLEYMKKLVEDMESGFLDELFDKEEEFFDDENETLYTTDHWEEHEEMLVRDAFDKYYISLPLYLYDHSGITMSTGPFSCPWDSGQVGFIYVSRKRAEEKYGAKEFPLTRTVLLDPEGILRGPPGRTHDRVFESLDELTTYYLRGEVEVYDQFLRGEVYGFVLEDLCGEEFDSCWGFFGDDWRTNGIADCIDESEIAKVQIMMPAMYHTHEIYDEEEFDEDQVA